MTASHPLSVPRRWFARLAGPLDRRSAPRLALPFLGAVPARGRRTVTRWIRAAKLSGRFRPRDAAVAAAGKEADRVAARLLVEAVKPLVAGDERLTLALDDTPTPRYGPRVQGAGVHHNPAPGPAGSPFVSGHVFVALGLLARHPSWGVVAPPLLARLYVRDKDLIGIDPKHRPPFRTEPELAAESLRWADPRLGRLETPIRVVADAAYAKAASLKPAICLGRTVVSRLRKDAALRTAPGPRPPGRRGRPRTYGEDVIDPAKRGGQRRGWSAGVFDLYGEAMVRRSETFPATWRPAGGAIRVVPVDEPTGWRAFFCTDPSASVADVPEAVADRFGPEISVRDGEAVVGAGRQRVRVAWANVGASHVGLWTFPRTEAWAWGRSVDDVVDRSASPWGSPSRRPSHADKRRAWHRALLGEEIRAVLPPGVTELDIQATADRLLSLAA